jgi:hypothetical protein
MKDRNHIDLTNPDIVDNFISVFTIKGVLLHDFSSLMLLFTAQAGLSSAALCIDNSKKKGRIPIANGLWFDS